VKPKFCMIQRPFEHSRSECSTIRRGRAPQNPPAVACLAPR
jgi:hypothetical protein